MSDRDPSQAPRSQDWGAWPDLPASGERRKRGPRGPRATTPEPAPRATDRPAPAQGSRGPDLARSAADGWPSVDEWHEQRARLRAATPPTTDTPLTGDGLPATDTTPRDTSMSGDTTEPTFALDSLPATDTTPTDPPPSDHDEPSDPAVHDEVDGSAAHDATVAADDADGADGAVVEADGSGDDAVEADDVAVAADAMVTSDWHSERRTAVAVPPAWGPGRDIAPPTFTWPGQQSSPSAEPDTGPADEAAAGLGGERGGLLDAIASGWGQSAEERDRAEEGVADRRTGDRAGGRPFQGRSEDRAEAPIFVWPGERTGRSGGDAAAAGGPSDAGAVRAGKGVSGRRKKRTRNGEGVTEDPLNEVGGRGGEGFSGGELREPDAQDGSEGSERRRGEREDPHEPSGVVEGTPGAEVPPKAKYDADGWHSEVLAGSSWFAEEQQASGRKRSSKDRSGKERSGKGRRAGGRGAGGESGHSEEEAAGNGSSGENTGGNGSSGGDVGASGSSWADAKGSGSFRTAEGGSGSVGGGSEGNEQFGGSEGSGLFGGGGSEEGGLFAGGSGGSGRSGRRAKASGRFGRGTRGRGALPDGPDAESSAAAGPEADPESVARAICLRLLTMAPKTRAQLAEALRKRDVPDEAAEKVLDRFAELGLINDEAFAEAWVDSRHHGRGLAKRALAAELRHRGVDTDTVKEAVDRLDSDQEAETARRLVERKLASTRSLDPQTRTRRLAGMLARKGYSSGVAYRVIREALEQEGIDLEDDFS
ncbi:hypothetical protein GCM10010176_067380 [Nonomuraea spiralis]|nr:hypothetical protein GCM10010176_067380 [Nonomuraea spiralis]